MTHGVIDDLMDHFDGLDGNDFTVLLKIVQQVRDNPEQFADELEAAINRELYNHRARCPICLSELAMATKAEKNEGEKVAHIIVILKCSVCKWEGVIS